MNSTLGLILPQIESDGKLVVTPAPNTKGFQTFYTGAGDALGPPVVRGGGVRLRLEWTAEEDRGSKDAPIQFAEPIELHDGEAYFTPADGWDVDDLLSFRVDFPETEVVVNGGNTGNCTLQDLGGYFLILPAAGDGTHDVDLAEAIPIPAGVDGGFWTADRFTGVVAPAAAALSGDFNLLTVPMSAWFAKNVPLGNAMGIFAVDAYKVQWLHHRWSLVMSVNKQSAGAGKIAGWLLAYREKTV